MLYHAELNRYQASLGPLNFPVYKFSKHLHLSIDDSNEIALNIVKSRFNFSYV